VLMTWLCTIETYIWIFLHSSDCVSVRLVCNVSNVTFLSSVLCLLWIRVV